MDALEATTNATLGLCVSVIAVWALWPLFGWAASPAQSVGVTGLFWALSTVRGYIVRKAFRRINDKKGADHGQKTQSRAKARVRQADPADSRRA